MLCSFFPHRVCSQQFGPHGFVLIVVVLSVVVLIAVSVIDRFRPSSFPCYSFPSDFVLVLSVFVLIAVVLIAAVLIVSSVLHRICPPLLLSSSSFLSWIASVLHHFRGTRFRLPSVLSSSCWHHVIVFIVIGFVLIVLVLVVAVLIVFVLPISVLIVCALIVSVLIVFVSSFSRRRLATTALRKPLGRVLEADWRHLGHLGSPGGSKAVPNDFSLIFARVNFKSGHSTAE